MFDQQVYVDRRRNLRSQLGSGLILFLGNDNSSINYADNHYPFRQDSTFLYYFGLNQPGLVGIIDIDNEQEFLFGNEPDLSSIIWTGALPSLQALGEKVGVENTHSPKQLGMIIRKACTSHRKVHFLPPYRPEHEKHLSNWLEFPQASLPGKISVELIKAIVNQRSHKSEEEVAEIEKAVDITTAMQLEVMRSAQAGMKEVELVAKIYQVALEAGATMSFPPIITVNGQILHNHSYDNILAPGQMLLCDCGAESNTHYAGDLSRTFPLNPTFDARQRAVYEVVLKAHRAAIVALRPGVLFKDIHVLVCQTLVDGLKAIGLMRGDSQEAVQAGAHALFFQCGLGHMMGMDVHDMENLGEQYVGYTPELNQSTEFGLRSLRLGRALEEGFVLTVEPGIYMIPELIDLWQNENKNADFINYDEVAKFKDFGGIRMEDDFLITPEGSRQLGNSLPLTVAEIEEVRSSN